MSALNRRKLLTATGLGVAAVAVPAGTATAAPSPRPGTTPRRAVVQTGAEVLAAQGFSLLRGRKLGIITNPTGVDSRLRSIVDVMHETGDLTIVGIFGPEHGFRGTAQAGGSEGTSIDPRTGLTVYDAYGAGVAKMTELFRTAGVDTVLFDIQDAGARFYTYIWTMFTAMQAAIAVDAEFVVLDRPNPLGGKADGPMMTPAFTSGVGAGLIVQQHGMTVGELARYFDAELLPEVAGRRVRKLTVVQMKGWRPDMRYADTGLAWVPPSPNMPTPDTALLYPGTGMFEGVVLTEGRGTTRPFEILGAPFVDYRWAETLAAQDLPGVRIRECYFTPTFGKFTGEVCGGVQVHLDDIHAVQPIPLAIHLLVAARRLYPAFAWRQDSWDPKRPYWIDKLTGSTRLREQISAGASATAVISAYQRELSAFTVRRQRHLLYPGPRR